MEERKTYHTKLTEEQLNKVSGGVLYDEPRDIIFKYRIGYTKEICDHDGLFHDFTHPGTITRRGYIWTEDIWGDDAVEAVYFFSGHSDIQGWYEEWMIPKMGKNNYADDDRIDERYVTVVD